MIDHHSNIKAGLAAIQQATSRIEDAKMAQLRATQDRDTSRNLAERYQGERQQADKDARAMPDNERLVEIARTRRERAQIAQDGANEAETAMQVATQAVAAAELALLAATQAHRRAELAEEHEGSLVQAREFAHPLAEAFLLLPRAIKQLQDHLLATEKRVAEMRRLGMTIPEPDALPVAVALAEKLLEASAGLSSDHEFARLRWAADHLLPRRPPAKVKEFTQVLLDLAGHLLTSWPQRHAIQAEVQACEGLHSWGERQAVREAERPEPKATGAATFAEGRLKNGQGIQETKPNLDALTPAELVLWAEKGEWPERLKGRPKP